MKPALQKPLLYRPVNTRTHGVRHGSCRAYRYERHTKSEKDKQSNRGSMHSHQRHGFDYTPLFRFLLSKVGHPWDQVFSEAKPAWIVQIRYSGWSRNMNATSRIA